MFSASAYFGLISIAALSSRSASAWRPAGESEQAKLVVGDGELRIEANGALEFLYFAGAVAEALESQREVVVHLSIVGSEMQGFAICVRGAARVSGSEHLVGSIVQFARFGVLLVLAAELRVFRALELSRKLPRPSSHKARRVADELPASFGEIFSAASNSWMASSVRPAWTSAKARSLRIS